MSPCTCANMSRVFFTERDLSNPKLILECLELKEGKSAMNGAEFRGFAKGWFPEGWVSRMFPGTKNRNEGTFGCSPGTKNRNKGTFGCSRYQKPERGYIRENHPFSKPPFCFLSRVENLRHK